jgi:hypothetical protein
MRQCVIVAMQVADRMWEIMCKQVADRRVVSERAYLSHCKKKWRLK